MIIHTLTIYIQPKKKKKTKNIYDYTNIKLCLSWANPFNWVPLTSGNNPKQVVTLARRTKEPIKEIQSKW